MPFHFRAIDCRQVIKDHMTLRLRKCDLFCWYSPGFLPHKLEFRQLAAARVWLLHLSMKTDYSRSRGTSVFVREEGQAVIEYAFLFAVLLTLIGIMTAVGVHVNFGLNWIASTI